MRIKAIVTLLVAVVAMVSLSPVTAVAAPKNSSTTTAAPPKDPDNDNKGPDRGDGADNTDRNRGCGNDADRTDDNEGRCRGNYPPRRPANSGSQFASFGAVTLSSTAVAGTAVDTEGSGWLADSQVQVTIPGPGGEVSQLGAFPVDATGEFAAEVRIPADVPAGKQLLTISGADAGREQRSERIPLIVTPPVASVPPEQGGTVVTVGMAGLAGVVVLMAGAAALRRRRLANNHYGR